MASPAKTKKRKPRRPRKRISEQSEKNQVQVASEGAVISSRLRTAWVNLLDGVAGAFGAEPVEVVVPPTPEEEELMFQGQEAPAPQLVIVGDLFGSRSSYEVLSESLKEVDRRAT